MFWLGWHILLGHRVCIIDTDVILPRTEMVLKRIVERLHASGRICLVNQDCPELKPYDDFIDLRRATNIFEESEPWLEGYFEFPRMSDSLGAYAQPYKQLCCNYIFHRYFSVYVLREIFSKYAADEVRIYGLSDFLASFYEERFNQPIPGNTRQYVGPRIAANIVFAVLSALYAAGISLSRIRLATAKREPAFIGIDYIKDVRNSYLIEEIDDGPGRFVFVARNRKDMKELESMGMLDHPPACHHVPEDAHFSFGEGLRAARESVRDSLNLLRVCGRLVRPVFCRLALLPGKRMLYRALIQTHRFKFFFGRDDYNVEHQLRSQELRKTGGVSIGISHGLPGLYPIIEQIRYIDFDIYYTFGIDQYRRFYHKTWPAHMRVRPVGSFGLPREGFHALAKSRPANIICFLEPSFMLPRSLDVLDELSRTFPEKTIYISIKSKYLSGPFGKRVQRFVEDGHPNIVIHMGKSYDLFFKAQFVVSECSSLVPEAIQFGLTAFVMDLDPRWKRLYYRDFPDLCVTSGKEAVERIRKLESGQQQYRREEYAQFINLTGVIVWDVLREDLGLPPRSDAPLPHLSFVPPSREVQSRELDS